jgi:GNAT superfamily N-acetyltransferase
MTVSPDLAEAFVNRYGLADYQPLANDLAWGAFEDAHQLIGVAVLSKLLRRGRIWFVVTPERRRLGVGSELVAVVTTTAQELGLQYLAFRYRANDAAPQQLVRSLGRPLGRTNDAGIVNTVIVLPPRED